MAKGACGPEILLFEVMTPFRGLAVNELLLITNRISKTRNGYPKAGNGYPKAETGYPKAENGSKSRNRISKSRKRISKVTQNAQKCARRLVWITVVIGDRAHSPKIADLGVPVGGRRSAGRFLNDVYG